MSPVPVLETESSCNKSIPSVQAPINSVKLLHNMQFLVSELAQEESDLLQPGLDYPVWSPYDASSAAETMLKLLEAAKKIG